MSEKNDKRKDTVGVIALTLMFLFLFGLLPFGPVSNLETKIRVIDSRLSESKRTIDDQQRQIDKLKRELEDVKRK